MSLPTNYKDDLLDTSQNTTRIYDVVNGSGTVVQGDIHLVDKTVYSQNGTELGAQDINNICSLLNNLTQYFDRIEVVDNIPSNPGDRVLYFSKN